MVAVGKRGGEQRQQRLPVGAGRGHCRLDVSRLAQRDDLVVLRDRTPAAQRREAQPLQAPQHRRELFEDGADGVIGAGHDRHTVKVVVGGERRIGVVATQGAAEARVRLAHGIQLGGRQVRQSLPDGQFVHGGCNRLSLMHGTNVQGTDPGVAARLRLHQTGLLQSRQRFPHRGTADTQPLH